MKRKKLLMELTEEELVILTAKAYKTMADLIKNADMYTRAMVGEDIRANAMFADDALQAMEEHIIPAINIYVDRLHKVSEWRDNENDAEEKNGRNH